MSRATFLRQAVEISVNLRAGSPNYTEVTCRSGSSRFRASPRRTDPVWAKLAGACTRAPCGHAGIVQSGSSLVRRLCVPCASPVRPLCAVMMAFVADGLVHDKILAASRVEALVCNFSRPVGSGFDSDWWINSTRPPSRQAGTRTRQRGRHADCETAGKSTAVVTISREEAVRLREGVTQARAHVGSVAEEMRL